MKENKKPINSSPASFKKINTLTPQTPTTPPEDPLWKLILRVLYTTKPGIILSTLILISFFTKVFPLGIFGVRSVFLAVLMLYSALEIRKEKIKTNQDGEKPDFLWLGIILFPTLLLGYFEVSFLWKQQAATALTQEISGNPNAWAECQRFTPALFADSLKAGFYSPSQDKDKSVIQYIYCEEWGNFYFSDKDSLTDIQTLWSVGTVIHEAIHVSGELDEAVTQCLTNRAFPNVLKEYGVSKKKLQEYTERYIQESRRMPLNYQRGECENHPLIRRIPRYFKTSY